MTQKVKFKKLRPDATIPGTITHGSAGYDICVAGSHKLKYGRQVLPTGLSVEMPRDMMMYVQPKSGQSLLGMTAFAGPDYRHITVDADVLLGLVDSDYRGEIGIIIDCKDIGVAGGEDVWITHGTNIAQITFHTVPQIEIEETQELTPTTRGTDGFGKRDEKRDNR